MQVALQYETQEGEFHRRTAAGHPNRYCESTYRGWM
jgi:hypothetical protein